MIVVKRYDIEEVSKEIRNFGFLMSALTLAPAEGWPSRLSADLKTPIYISSRQLSSNHYNDHPKSCLPSYLHRFPIIASPQPSPATMSASPPRPCLRPTTSNPRAHPFRTRPLHFPKANRPQPISTRRQNTYMAIPLLTHQLPVA